MFDVQKIREDFPVLNQQVFDKPYIYLDNAATTHKPQAVLDTIARLFTKENSNIHRGVHHFSVLTTEHYEEARKTIAQFIHAGNEKEIVFTHGTTDSINLVAFSFGEKYIHKGDEIILSEMEHHSNIVPWQMVCQRKEAVIRVWKMRDDGTLDLNDLEKLISDKTRLIGITQVSNTLGTVNPVKEITDLAHRYEIPVLVDGAQGVQHVYTDVAEIGCDFYVFSGHKAYGPTGIGVLYAGSEWLAALPPYQGGGDMVLSVTFDDTTYLDAPYKFEAGTTNYIGAIGLGTALEYIQTLGLQEIFDHENQLLAYAMETVGNIPGVRIFGEAPQKVSVLSFLVDDIHAYDVGMILDKLGIAVRTGHHCAQPACNHFGVDGTVRASFAFYNTMEEVDQLAEAILQAKKMLS